MESVVPDSQSQQSWSEQLWRGGVGQRMPERSHSRSPGAKISAVHVHGPRGPSLSGVRGPRQTRTPRVRSGLGAHARARDRPKPTWFGPATRRQASGRYIARAVLLSRSRLTLPSPPIESSRTGSCGLASSVPILS